MKRILFIGLFLIVISIGWSFELLRLSDVPTAGMLQKGEVRMHSKLYRDNGLNLGAQVGLFPRFMFGVSYGAEQIVGNEEPNYHEKVEFNAKFRIVDESNKAPAVVIGFDSQGHGRYYDGAKRYDLKSKGFYASASRNFSFLGSFGIHGGLNYSLEEKDKDDDINFFLGFDKSLTNQIFFTVEYDLAINDNDGKQIELAQELEGKGKGYLNASFNISFTDNIRLKISTYDLLENSPNTIGMDRSITFNYFRSF